MSCSKKEGIQMAPFLICVKLPSMTIFRLVWKCSGCSCWPSKCAMVVLAIYHVTLDILYHVEDPSCWPPIQSKSGDRPSHGRFESLFIFRHDYQHRKNYARSNATNCDEISLWGNDKAIPTVFKIFLQVFFTRYLFSI